SGVSLSAAQAEMETIARHFQLAFPASNAGWIVNVMSLYDLIVGNVKPALLLLLTAVSFVLLIACVNVASLFSARLTARHKEIGVRVALGATRLRLVQQLLTESVVIGLLGGLGGVLLSFWGLRLLIRIIPPWFPRSNEIGLDTTVLGF